MFTHVYTFFSETLANIDFLKMYTFSKCLHFFSIFFILFLFQIVLYLQ